jgi:hypothetical protein
VTVPFSFSATGAKPAAGARAAAGASAPRPAVARPPAPAQAMTVPASAIRPVQAPVAAATPQRNFFSRVGRSVGRFFVKVFGSAG